MKGHGDNACRVTTGFDGCMKLRIETFQFI